MIVQIARRLCLTRGTTAIFMWRPFGKASFLLVALCAALLAPRAVCAQQDDSPDISLEELQRSHRLDDNFAPPPGLREQIESLVKKRQSKQFQDIVDLYKNNKLKPEDILKNRPLLEELRKNHSTPDVLKRAIDHLMDPEHTPFSAQDLDELKKYGQAAPQLPPEQKQGGLEKNDDAQAGALSTSNTPDDPNNGRDSRDGTGRAGSLPEKAPTYADRIMKWLSSSPAMRKVMRELGRHVGEDDPRWDRLAEGMGTIKERWDRLAKGWELDRFFSKDADWLGRLVPDSLPDLRAPSRSSLPSLTQTPADGDGFFSSGSSSWLPLVLSVGVLAVLLAIVWSVRAQQTAASRKPAWQPGPWPVNPTEIRTRGELVKAFDYLSLLNFGLDAQSWNHRVIAEQLGEKPSAGRQIVTGPGALVPNAPAKGLRREQVAQELADLYEKARYAPPGESLTDAGLAAARTDLCLLAGVSVV
jgi:hypothetical protein